MGKIKLISLDVDGTLLSSKGDLPPGNQAAIKLAIQQDVRVVLNTGKPPCTLQILVGQLGLRDPISTLGGALILDLTDPDHWTPIHSETLPQDLLSRLKDLIGELPLTIQINTENETYFYNNKKTSPEYLDYVNHHYAVKNGFPYLKIIETSPFEEFKIDPSPVIKLTFHSDEDQPVDEAFKRIKTIEDDIVMIGYSSPRTIDISPRPSGKKQAIEFLCGRYGFGPDNVMALGDYETDLELINWAGVGAVMANAPDFVKAEAPFLAPTNDQAGVARMIEEYVLSNKCG